MTRDHFKQVYTSPYFQSDHYRNETAGGIAEKKLKARIKNLLSRLRRQS